VNPDKRNANVVGVLFIALTVGAGALLMLEPRAQRWQPDALLMAHNGSPIESLTIDYPTAEFRGDLTQYDCVVPADGGPPTWNPRSPRIRVLVAPSAGDRIPHAQKEALLGLIGGLFHGNGLDLKRVAIEPRIDSRQSIQVPAQARDLCQWLIAKGFVQ